MCVAVTGLLTGRNAPGSADWATCVFPTCGVQDTHYAHGSVAQTHVSAGHSVVRTVSAGQGKRLKYRRFR